MSKTTYNPETRTWHGPVVPLTYNPDASLGQIILSVLKMNSSSIAEICAETGLELTCHEIRIRTIRIAMKLQELGYKEGDILGVHALNSENMAPLVFACFTLGIGMNFLAPNYNKNDIFYMWGIVKPKFVFCDPQYFQMIKESLAEMNLVAPIMTLVQKIEGHHFIDEMIVPNGREKDFRAPNLENVEKVIGIILCSSGTTGPQKPVSLSQKQLIYQITPFWNTESLTDDIIFNMNSLYAITGVFCLLVSTLYCFKRIISNQLPSVSLLRSIVQKYNVTIIQTTPYLIASLLEFKDQEPLESIRDYLVIGAVVPKIIYEKLKRMVPNAKISNSYGVTETGGAPSYAEDRVDNIGQLTQNIILKIVDGEDQNLGPNEVGEICIKSPVEGMGYYGSPELTKKVYRDGWVYTGDLGRVDSNGVFHFVGRKKEIMKYQNYHISPSELEDIIDQIDGVMDSCVVGIQNDAGNDIIYAVIRKKYESLTEQFVIDYVNARVSDVKKLRGGVIFVNEFPTTPSHKVVREEVKELVELSLKNEINRRSRRYPPGTH